MVSVIINAKFDNQPPAAPAPTTPVTSPTTPTPTQAPTEEQI
jgi:hypothetical protein